MARQSTYNPLNVKVGDTVYIPIMADSLVKENNGSNNSPVVVQTQFGNASLLNSNNIGYRIQNGEVVEVKSWLVSPKQSIKKIRRFHYVINTGGPNPQLLVVNNQATVMFKRLSDLRKYMNQKLDEKIEDIKEHNKRAKGYVGTYHI